MVSSFKEALVIYRNFLYVNHKFVVRVNKTTASISLPDEPIAIRQLDVVSP